MYPRYADKVNFIAVGVDPSEGPEVLRSFQQNMGYPWTVTLGDRQILERYNVLSTSIKYAVNRRGIITMHRGYGAEDAKVWERLFEELVRG